MRVSASGVQCLDLIRHLRHLRVGFLARTVEPVVETQILDFRLVGIRLGKTQLLVQVGFLVLSLLVQPCLEQLVG